MNTTENNIAQLLTGSEDTDHRIQTAYEMGLRQGRIEDRKNLQRSAQIDTTRRLLAALMRTQGIDLQTAMITLQIPKADRKTYIRIFANKQKK